MAFFCQIVQVFFVGALGPIILCPHLLSEPQLRGLLNGERRSNAAYDVNEF